MYKCRECGEYFEEPLTFIEKYEAYGSPCYESFTVCPYCESNDFDEDWIVEEEEEEEEKWLEEQNTNLEE